MTLTGMWVYSALIILHYYFIIIFCYDNIILSYYYIIFAQYNIYWHFFNQGVCSRMAPYQWFWIIEDCFRHIFSTRIFSMLKKNIQVSRFLCFFWAQAPGARTHGPRPLGPMGPPIFRCFLKIWKMVRDLCKSVPMVFRSLGKQLIKLFYVTFN